MVIRKADGSGDYAKEKCIATNSGWVFMPSTATGSDNTNSQPEKLLSVIED